jgi:hypothetical protein
MIRFFVIFLFAHSTATAQWKELSVQSALVRSWIHEWQRSTLPTEWRKTLYLPGPIQFNDSIYSLYETRVIQPWRRNIAAQSVSSVIKNTPYIFAQRDMQITRYIHAASKDWKIDVQGYSAYRMSTGVTRITQDVVDSLLDASLDAVQGRLHWLGKSRLINRQSETKIGIWTDARVLKHDTDPGLYLMIISYALYK